MSLKAVTVVLPGSAVAVGGGIGGIVGARTVRVSVPASPRWASWRCPPSLAPLAGAEEGAAPPCGGGGGPRGPPGTCS